MYEEIATTTHHLLRHSLEAIEAFGPGPLSDDELSDTWTAYSTQIFEDAATTINGRRTNDQLDETDVFLLQRAVQPYFEVIAKGLSWPDLGEEDRRRRAQLILLPNVRLLAYEQKRVQPVLQRNLAYLPETVRSWLGGELTWGGTRSSTACCASPTSVRGRPRAACGRCSRLLPPEASTRWSSAPRNCGSVATFPCRRRPTLCCELASRSRTGSGTARERSSRTTSRTCNGGRRGPRFSVTTGPAAKERRTAVDNWLRYGERLNFLVNLFRSRQQVSTLYSAPRSAPTLPVAFSKPLQLLPGLPPVPPLAQQALPHFDGGNP